MKMAKYQVITFEEFVEYGKQNSNNIVNGVPWSFEYNGYQVTHENDECYLIVTPEEVLRFTPGDLLIVGVTGEIYTCKRRDREDKVNVQERLYKGREAAENGVLPSKDETIFLYNLVEDMQKKIFELERKLSLYNRLHELVRKGIDQFSIKEQYGELKIEVGNSITEWKPAPEDITFNKWIQKYY